MLVERVQCLIFKQDCLVFTEAHFRDNLCNRLSNAGGELHHIELEGFIHSACIQLGVRTEPHSYNTRKSSPSALVIRGGEGVVPAPRRADPLRNQPDCQLLRLRPTYALKRTLNLPAFRLASLRQAQPLFRILLRSSRPERTSSTDMMCGGDL